MSRRRLALISVDGASGTAVAAAARAALTSIDRPLRGGVSTWDASGLFQDVAVAEQEAGRPSVRTLLLLYAADLAFRLRWEIRPTLAEGRIVVAAPYVDTAIALGRAAGLSSGWLANLFRFAPKAAESRYVDPIPARAAAADAGLLEFVLDRMVMPAELGRDRLVERTRAHVRTLARRGRRRAPARKRGRESFSQDLGASKDSRPLF